MIPGTQVDGWQAASLACELAAVEVEEGCPIPGTTHEAAAHATIRIIAAAMARTVVNPALALCAQHAFLSPRLDNIPVELCVHARFLLWRAEGPAGTKLKKVPYVSTMRNSHGSSTDPYTWSTFDQTVAAHEEGGYTGIGFVLNNDGLVGIDIDHCVREGVIDVAALELMNKLAVNYFELSPSGTGLRGFGYGDILEKGTSGTYNGLHVELYSNVRFLTVTGLAIKNAPLTPLNGFKELADQLRADKRVNAETGQVLDLPAAEWHAELLRRIQSGENYHHSLLALAASNVGCGMYSGAVVNQLRAIMMTVAAPHDGRWKDRYDSIPSLVSSAVEKYKYSEINIDGILIAEGGTYDSPAQGVAPQPRYKLLTATDLANAPPLKWMIRSLFPQTGLAALYGASGTGKSFLALDLAVTVAGGGAEWYGMRVTKCPVTYCVLEGEGGMGKRAKAWAQHHNKALPGELRFVTQPINLLNQDDVRELAAAVMAAGGRGGFIILDTLNRAAPQADENSSKDMSAIIAAAKALQVLTGGLVMLVHHTGKDSERGMRGHSSLFAAMDSVISVSKTQWEVKKSKDDATGTEYKFKLETLVLGLDDEGEEVTSCVAVPVAASFALRQSKKLGPHQLVALETIKGMATDFISGVHVDEAVAAVAERLDVDDKHKRERAKAAIGSLNDMGKLKIETNYVRIV